MIFMGFYIRSENLIFQADFLILNLCGVHVVVANFSLISGFFNAESADVCEGFADGIF